MIPEIQIKDKSDAWDMSDLHPGLRWQFSVNAGSPTATGYLAAIFKLTRVLNCRFIFIKSRKFT